jgi:hypothetical protein
MATVAGAAGPATARSLETHSRLQVPRHRENLAGAVASLVWLGEITRILELVPIGGELAVPAGARQDGGKRPLGPSFLASDEGRVRLTQELPLRGFGEGLVLWLE